MPYDSLGQMIAFIASSIGLALAPLYIYRTKIIEAIKNKFRKLRKKEVE
jgi:hypothetical protein